MKTVYISVMLGVLFLSLGVYLLVQDKTVEVDESYKDRCPNFNSKDFLLTGGSSNPQNLYELDYELKRLNWLCNGGSG
jgi:hypothetical protein